LNGPGATLPDTAFKSYDIRGRLGVDLTPELMERLGRAVVRVQGARSVVTGRDIRASSAELQAALHAGLVAEGAEVRDIGLCGTEEVYFATDHYGAAAGLMITASHNPMDYNGVKMVGPGAAPIPQAGLAALRSATCGPQPGPGPGGGRVRPAEPRAAWVQRVLRFAGSIGPLRVGVNAGNGAAGPSFDALAAALEAPVTWHRVHHAPDGRFPNGIPNPLLPENRSATANAVRDHGADLGVAWDGDFDRCFFFDETGGFVDGEYVVALLARAFLARDPGAAIIHDPRVIWATTETVAAAGGRAIASRTGHAHLKAAMRETGAVYGGEMSAHHYFREFMYCDSGMIPMLLVLSLLSESGQSLSRMVGDLRAAYPSSGEINFRLADPAAAEAAVDAAYGPQASATDRLDGLSLTFADWRLNLRRSNTEPVLRLNAEARGDRTLLQGKVADLTKLITETGRPL